MAECAGEPSHKLLFEDNEDHAKQVIREMREHRGAERVHIRVPVGILTSSGAGSDIVRPCDYHANNNSVAHLEVRIFKKLMNDPGFYRLGWNAKPTGD